MTSDIGSHFWEKTKPAHLSPSDQSRKVPPPPAVILKDDDLSRIHLPSPLLSAAPPVDFLSLATNRISHRRFAETNLSMEELSFLLWCTQGVKKSFGNITTFRTVPSAGARHALETFIYVNRVKGLEKGIYGYAPMSHSLFPHIKDPSLDQSLASACYKQMFVVRAAVTFIWVAVPYRMTWRYSERGYRYLLLDAGHVCQNLYLASESIDCGVCAVGAFDDDAMNMILDLDEDASFVIYLASVGKKIKREPDRQSADPAHSRP